MSRTKEEYVRLAQRTDRVKDLLQESIALAEPDSDEYMDIATMSFYIRAVKATVDRKLKVMFREARRIKPDTAARVKVDKPRAKPLRSANRR